MINISLAKGMGLKVGSIYTRSRRKDVYFADCERFGWSSNKAEIVEEAAVAEPPEVAAPAPADAEKDLEDGEIEDDDDEEEIAPVAAPQPTPITPKPKDDIPKSDNKDRERRSERRRHSDDKKTKHMTEAEKSILHLRKRERMQREKWEKFRKEQSMETPVVDDFASNIEKAIASVLKKDKISGDEDKDDIQRGKKRKNRDKERKNNNSSSSSSKQRKIESEENDGKDTSKSPPLPFSDENSYDSDTSSEHSRKRDYKNKNKRNSNSNNNRSSKRKKSRERNRQQDNNTNNNNSNNLITNKPKNNTTSQSICVFFLQGKCPRVDCPYSHEVLLPMKLELCKFYLNDCCAKGEKCSYMHSEFPCKFYHTGLPCLEGDNCKFAHGKALTEGLTQILFKHIETAPREILGGFPRMSQDEVLNKINQTQQQLKDKYGQNNIPSLFDISCGTPQENLPEVKPKSEKRSRPSRWQDADPIETIVFNKQQPPPSLFPFVQQDQDMRITSNGDVDMRTLPPPPPQIIQTIQQKPQEIELKITGDIDIRPNLDVDVRLAQSDVDIRQIPSVFVPNPIITETEPTDDDDEESKLQIDTGEIGDLIENQKETGGNLTDLPNLPKTQRDLYLRIQAQQKNNAPEEDQEQDGLDPTINWYSDDDDDEDRLTIKVDQDEQQQQNDNIMSPTQQQQQQIKPMDVVEKLGDLSKIDISAEVTKLLTSITSQNKETTSTTSKSRDPRQARIEQQQQSNNKQSIYEQGSITTNNSAPQSPEIEEIRQVRPDVDLRNFNLPFKGMMNYTPAKEIDASINSHPPINWKVIIVDIPRPDYTGLKLNVLDAEKTGDPRLKKIFRLSTEEKDSPASPKNSPKSSGTSSIVRIDPRLKAKQEQDNTNQQLTYNQQLNILQSSAFFQSLTSNQKLLLNQELAMRTEQNGGVNDSNVLNSLLTNLNLIPNNNSGTTTAQLMGTAALNILANVNKLNVGVGAATMQLPPIQNPTIVNQMGMIQPGLLGAAPGIPNLPVVDFPSSSAAIGFDPRMQNLNNQNPNFISGGNFQQQQQDGNNYQFDDYYQDQQQQQQNYGHSNNNNNNNNRDNRNFNRDRRRGGGRNNFNRNSNRNFRNNRNRSNRSHTPP